MKGWALLKRERNCLNEVLPTLDSLLIHISKDDRFLVIVLARLRKQAGKWDDINYRKCRVEFSFVYLNCSRQILTLIYLAGCLGIVSAQ